jgi:alkylated DNA repair dioxygenase AlkB
MNTLFQDPEGFRYQPDFLNHEEEKDLVAELTKLDLRPFEFHGYLGNRRVTSFGYRYDFGKQAIQTADPIPSFLLPLQARIANFTNRHPDAFQQIGIQEYTPGAGIGWHKDRPQFGEVVGISLLTAAPMRLRRKQGNRWQRATQMVAPRSIYVLSGEARTIWEHSIPPMKELRYSITFRTLAPGFDPRKEAAA